MTQKATTLWLLVLGATSLFYGCTEEEPLSANYTIGTLEVSVPEKNAKGDNYDMGLGDSVKPDLCAVIVPSSGETFAYHEMGSRPRRARRDTCYRPYCPDSLSCTFTDVALTSGKFQVVLWDLDGMDGDGGEQIANLTCETGKETCEGKGVVIKLDARLASLADGTVGPKGARARPCKYAGGQSLDCMDFTENTRECVPENTPVFCRNKWVESRNYDRLQDRGLRINNWEKDGTWETRKGRLMLFETQRALEPAKPTGIWTSLPEVYKGKKRFSSHSDFTSIELFMTKAMEDKIHADKGVFRGLIKLLAYDENLIMDDLVAEVVAIMTKEEFDKEVLALEFEALLFNKPTYWLELPRVTSLPEVFGDHVLATKTPVDRKLQRDILLARDLDRYIAAFGEVYVASRLSREGLQIEAIKKAASEHKARQEALIAKMSPLQKLAWYGRPKEVFEKQTRADNWALMRPGSKNCDGKRVDMPKTANEFQYQALLPKVPELRKKRLKKYKEELQLISEGSTYKYNNVAKPGAPKTEIVSESILDLRKGWVGKLLEDGQYNFKKGAYMLEVRDLKIPLKMTPDEAQRYLNRPMPARIFFVDKFHKRVFPSHCNHNFKGSNKTKLVGYEVYIGDTLIASKCKGCEKYLAKLPK